MRALLDANLYLSYLLSTTRESSAVGAILAAAVDGRFTLLFTPGIADEVVGKVRERPDLARRITPEDVVALFADLAWITEFVARIFGPLPSVSRDIKDDYLIAHALAGGADVLVSWDRDLLDLERIDDLMITNPPGFLAALRDAGLIERGFPQ